MDLNREKPRELCANASLLRRKHCATIISYDHCWNVSVGKPLPAVQRKLSSYSVYMSIEDAPVKEIMKDMMEMSRGVQHPIRYGLGTIIHILTTLADAHLEACF